MNKYENIALDSPPLPPPNIKETMLWYTSHRVGPFMQAPLFMSVSLLHLVVVQKSEDRLSEKNKKLRHENME